MNQRVLTVFVSATVGAAAALSVCLVFFFYGYKPAKADEAQPQQPPSQNIMNSSPPQTPVPTIPPPKEIKASEVTSLSINTDYREFFDESSKCHKTYQEYFGDADGIYSLGSPCKIDISFDWDGNALKTLEIPRYDKRTKEWRASEKSVWKAKITDEDFAFIVERIVNNETFQNYPDGVLVTARNCRITAKYAGGSRVMMSNVGKTTVRFLPLMDAFKQLDARVNWEKAQ